MRIGIWIALAVLIAWSPLAYYLGLQTAEQFMEMFFGSLGWIVSLLIAFLYLETNRKDNRELKIHEIRKSLQINTYNEINSSLFDFSMTLKNKYNAWLTKLKFDLDMARNGQLKIDLYKRLEQIGILTLELDIYRDAPFLTFRKNEIALKAFANWFEYTFFVVDEVRMVMLTLGSCLQESSSGGQFSDDRYELVQGEIEKVITKLLYLNHCLHDIQVGVMNAFLSNVFNDSVSPRKSSEGFEHLQDFVTKDIVIQKRRDIEAMREKEKQKG